MENELKEETYAMIGKLLVERGEWLENNERTSIELPKGMQTEIINLIKGDQVAAKSKNNEDFIIFGGFPLPKELNNLTKEII